ncbi:hypothetical protein [Pseudomonas sp. Ps21-P2]|uniref:hypothetical protein n=1 Tax=Pseudomonas sp. Ps21-P2 TaxID=3080331 RepID=UPI00320B37F1
MEIRNNPTGRLLDLMVLARGCGDNQSARKAWAKVFTCDPGDTGAILSSLAGLINLVAQAKAATQEHVSRKTELYLEPFPNLEAMLSRINLDASWQSSRAYLDDRTISCLEFGDLALSEHFGTTLLTVDLVGQFLGDLDRLIQQCANSDVPEDLKKLFCKNLEDLRRALLAYRISGAAGLQEEIDRVAGAFVRHGHLIKEAGEDKESKDLTTSIFDMVGKLNESIQLAGSAATYGAMLVAPLTHLLGQLSS